MFLRFLASRVIGFLLLCTSLWAHSETHKLTITGSSTVAPLALEIGKRFEAQHKGVQVNVQTGGSSRGIADARSGMADIGMASRALAKSEHDLFEHRIALDGIALIVNAKNPVSELTDENIRLIYTGKITNWKDVGGLDKPITVVNKAEGRSTLELFLTYMHLKNSEIKASVVIGDNQQGIKTVVGNPYAIGYVSIGAAEFEEKYGAPIKRLPMDGVMADISQIHAGTFPLSRPLNLITKTIPDGLVKQFIDFSQSDAVKDLIAEQYFVAPQKTKSAITLSK